MEQTDGFKIEGGAIVNAYGPSYSWPFVLGYLSIAAIFVILWFWQERREVID